MQWFIDIIRGWVLLNFFTQTQLLASTIPLVVTGDPVPDCTGIYFAKGLYNGRLYYEHDHGTYFIWWDILCTDYNLSTGLGVKAPGFFWGPANNIEGQYSWADAYSGAAFVSEGYKYLHECYVDRGSYGMPDAYVLVDFTVDGNWHEFDLSGDIGPDAKAVAIRLKVRSTLVETAAWLRPHGTTSTFHTCVRSQQVANVVGNCNPVIGVDNAGKIDYKFSVNVDYIDLIVRGWWKI